MGFPNTCTQQYVRSIYGAPFIGKPHKRTGSSLRTHRGSSLFHAPDAHRHGTGLRLVTWMQQLGISSTGDLTIKNWGFNHQKLGFNKGSNQQNLVFSMFFLLTIKTRDLL